MTNNNPTFKTTAAPTTVRTRIDMLEHNIRVSMRQLKHAAEGREELTAEDIQTLQDEILTDQGHLKGIYFMLAELSLHC
jgi:hypothetical protein